MLRGMGVPVNETLDDGHLRLLELFLRITARRVGQVDRVADLDVIGQRDVLDLDAVSMINDQVPLGAYKRGCVLLGLPFAEKFDFLANSRDVSGKRLNRGHFEMFLRS